MVPLALPLSPRSPLPLRVYFIPQAFILWGKGLWSPANNMEICITHTFSMTSCETSSIHWVLEDSSSSGSSSNSDWAVTRPQLVAHNTNTGKELGCVGLGGAGDALLVRPCVQAKALGYWKWTQFKVESGSE